MAVGVATANAILLVTFAERARREGADAAAAAVDGARHRLRPILMTSCAMIAGMVPLALAFGEGGEQTAPLGRAVIGGLLAATLTTLLVLPSLFAVVQGGAPTGLIALVKAIPGVRRVAWLMAAAGTQSVSLDPDDPDSSYYDRKEKQPADQGAAPDAAFKVKAEWQGKES
jgi:predicted RND superfamily exporter protein